MKDDSDNIPKWLKNPAPWKSINKEGNVHSNTVWMKRGKEAAIRVPSSSVEQYESRGYKRGRK